MYIKAFSFLKGDDNILIKLAVKNKLF
jgi:hypothetical protein